MTNDALRRHVEDLKRNAEETAARAATEPDNWLLQVAARNQRDAAFEVGRDLAVAEAEESADILEWRLTGRRVSLGEVPMNLLAKLSDPLNKLLLRAAFFARNQQEPQHGVGEELMNELDLRLVGIGSGSARLFIKGTAIADTTGANALHEGIDNLLNALSDAQNFAAFYERLGELGESATNALRDTLKAVESEECSLQISWHMATGPRAWSATFDEVVRVRSLLDGTAEPTFRQAKVQGVILLLAANGRLQLVNGAGRKVTVRFNPRSQAAQVDELRLNQYVELSVTERVVVDPVSGEELSHYRLNMPEGQIH